MQFSNSFDALFVAHNIAEVFARHRVSQITLEDGDSLGQRLVTTHSLQVVPLGIQWCWDDQHVARYVVNRTRDRSPLIKMQLLIIVAIPVSNRALALLSSLGAHCAAVDAEEARSL